MWILLLGIIDQSIEYVLAATNSSLFCIIVFYHQLYKQAVVFTFFFRKLMIYFTECISKKGKKN